MGEHPPSEILVTDRRDGGGYVLTAHVDGDPGVLEDIGEPVTSPRCAGDYEPSVHPEPPDLDCPGLSAASTGRRQIDGEM